MLGWITIKHIKLFVDFTCLVRVHSNTACQVNGPNYHLCWKYIQPWYLNSLNLTLFLKRRLYPAPAKVSLVVMDYFEQGAFQSFHITDQTLLAVVKHRLYGSP